MAPTPAPLRASAPGAPLPPGAAPLRIAVPAFWDLLPADQANADLWNRLTQAGPVVSVSVIEASWPGTAAGNPAWKAQAQAHLDTLPGAVLGYVSTRVGGGRRTDGAVLALAQAWYAEFAQQIDGIYFDEIVLPEDPGSAAWAVSLVAQFKQARPAAKAMVLAGQCIDEAVVGPGIDWAVLWESREQPYREQFYPLILDPSRPPNTSNTIGQPIPPWWKNPQHRAKIVHVVHDCAEPGRQHVLGLANERNAGNVFVMDRRGTHPTTGDDDLYDHLPPYWEAEVREADSYYDFGFDPERALRAAHRYGVGEGKLHAWPNFEQAWYPAGHVRGTFLLDAGPHAVQVDVALAALPGAPSAFDVTALWRAGHLYAQMQGYETALPTFEAVQTPAGPGVRLILLARNLAWLTPQTVPLAAAYQQPTFAEPGAVVRNVGRWAGDNGYRAAFPTFVPDDPTYLTGRAGVYHCYALSHAAPISWADVPTPVYLQQL